MQTVIALGFFDGVHLGHGDLLARAAAVAAEHGWRSAALTFDRSPGKDGRLLTAVPDRVRLIRELYGVDEVFVLPFTEEFKHLDWETFLEGLVREREAAWLICGWNYRFGHLGRGTPELLRDWCAARGLGCDVIPPRVIDGVTVSSTHIKKLIEAGDVEAAARFCGHPHSLTGTVRTGRGLGHTLGFPTANLLPAPELVLPKDGVYAVRCAVCEQGDDEHRGRFSVFGNTENRPLCSDAASVAQAVRRCNEDEAEMRRCSGVCNVGVRPTVDGQERTVETWLDGFDGDLYGKELTVEFCRFLRPEQKFPDLETLRRQVEADREAALAYFESQTSDACPCMA